MRMRWQVAVALAAVTVVTGCTVTVGGSASPVPGQGPVVTAVDACALLDQAQVDALGYQSPGRSVKENKDRLQPPMCLWSSKDDVEPSAVLNVGVASDMDFNEYISGAVKKSGPERIGGLSWTQYASILPDDCVYYALLGAKSFAYVSVSAGKLDKSCELAKVVIPQVAAHLPGGQDAPPVTPTTSAKPEPGGPLLSADPCAMLKPDQVAQLKDISPTGEKDTSSTVPNASFCLWDDTDGDGGQKAFEVWFGPSTPVGDWPGAKGVTPTETVDVGGKKWGLFPNMGGLRVTCGATLAITDTSSVQVVSGFVGDDTKTCDLVKQGLPLVTANLPG
ncbi:MULTISPECIES: DUF3558 family protein [unclassified Amycolatopsis]|uniref:DUF3558 family protein n=1 Tax=unclassified Amycolatopsis TaxID=2618356 RepID=UPI002876C73E|nr:MULTISPECIES: DUF3558 family protein [unclassified Amycolatopsis]MDS0132883.1 DUF3558 family protein [Amycolatopsis sp. 505]MDS0142292.1 DUF3558 family protein [Amycolatopsis sp. CM201R]